MIDGLGNSEMLDSISNSNPPGACSKSMFKIDHKPLQCSFGQTVGVNLKRMAILSKVIIQRRMVMEVCYAGGDSGHNDQVDQRMIQLMHCHGILTRSWKKKK